ncbi:uncharacterized protein LOC141632326 [Silene latifolia]|uniref:uncharacterized protein LOC141632326 n=1 Tax=Silene latifolia TaxID=37657 RepID=UPI003D77522A
MKEAAPESYADSPFIDEITRVDLPKKFVIPSIRTYDGTSDPQNHVAFYKQKMLVASIPSEFRQVCMCKGFGTTLTGPALQWFINLPNGSIKSFADLVNTFNQQFASKRELEKHSSDLYRVTQIKDEPHELPSVEVFRQGLLPNNDLYVELTKYPCHSFEDFQAKTLAYIRLVEDKSYKFGGSCNPKDYDKPNRKSGGRSNNYRSGPYTRLNQSEVNLMQEQQGLIKRLDNMGPVVRWPRKSDNPNPRKDHTKWCIPDVHYDGLVISMQIETTNVRMILVDGGSSVDLIMLDVLKAMKIKEDQITKNSSVLVGFSGETKRTLGEIYLPTYVEGLASYERFGVLDFLSSYNVILGRPWIHNIKVVPSTYHQCIKIPTYWGVATIKGEHKLAQECNTEVLKHSKAVRPELVSFLKNKSSCFAWPHFDLTGISADVITHKLNIDTSYKPVQQKRRKFASKRNTIINEEVDKLSLIWA